MKHLQFTRELDLCNNKNRKKGKTNSLRNSLKKGLQSFPSPRPRSKSHWKIAARIWGEKEIGWFGLLSNGGSTKCDRPIFTPYCTNVQSEQGCWLHKLGTPLLFQGVTNIRIFKKIRIFSNTFVSYLYNFFDTNIFGYSFVSFFLDINILEYLFVSKFHIRHTLLCSAGPWHPHIMVKPVMPFVKDVIVILNLLAWVIEEHLCSFRIFSIVKLVSQMNVARDLQQWTLWNKSTW